EQVRAEVRLLLELLDVEAVRAAVHAPVDVAEVVAGLVHPVLGELDGETAVRRAVYAGEESLDDVARDELEAAERGELAGCAEIRAARPHDPPDRVSA